MAYESGTLVALKGGGFVSVSNSYDGGVSTVTYQLYDQSRTAAGGPVQIASAQFFGLEGTQVAASDLVALDRGGFAIATATNFTGRFGGGSASIGVNIYGPPGTASGSYSAVVHPTDFDNRSVEGGAPRLIPLSNGAVMVMARYSSSDPATSGLFVTTVQVDGTLFGGAKGPVFVTPDFIVDVNNQVELVGIKDGQPALQLIGYGGATSALGPITSLAGAAGADTLDGGGGSDSLSGGAGADRIWGHGGYDVYAGGDGADTFVFTTGFGAAAVTDFNAAEDRILVANGLGVAPNFTGSILAFDRGSGALSFDPDGDNVGGSPQTLGALPGVAKITPANLDPSFQPTYLRTVNYDGSHDDLRTDYANAEAFKTVTASYDPANRMTHYSVVNDDGSHWLRVFDAANGREWTSTVAEYDSHDGLFAYTVFHDDGSRTLWRFDAGDTQTWSRVLEEYDAQGRLTQQSAANDDGTAFERHIDAADTQPWAYYIDNFRAGSLTDHTFYNADGSVFH